MIDLLRKSVLAGIFISIGGIINLKIGGVLGAFLFSFGLLSVVHYSLPLYTGRSGFCESLKDIKHLPIILLGNILGTFIIGICIHYGYSELVEKADIIVLARQQSSVFNALYSSIMCGLIMTTIVTFAKKNKYIPLLIGIPLFILSGFWHSIADAFYYSVSLKLNNSFWYIYLLCVLGNYIGCNIYNLLITSSFLKRKNNRE